MLSRRSLFHVVVHAEKSKIVLKMKCFGYCPIYGKKMAKCVYDAYHVSGGSDAATQ